jgi:hypothetical protein
LDAQHSDHHYSVEQKKSLSQCPQFRATATNVQALNTAEHSVVSVGQQISA